MARLAACALVLSFVVAAGSAHAISADLAKRCREEAIKAHPPLPGTKQAYASAEREVFRACLERDRSEADGNVTR